MLFVAKPQCFEQTKRYAALIMHIGQNDLLWVRVSMSANDYLVQRRPVGNTVWTVGITCTKSEIRLNTIYEERGRLLWEGTIMCIGVGAVM